MMHLITIIEPDMVDNGFILTGPDLALLRKEAERMLSDGTCSPNAYVRVYDVAERRVETTIETVVHLSIKKPKSK